MGNVAPQLDRRGLYAGSDDERGDKITERAEAHGRTSS
jgi:hypothetical protein